LLYIVCTREMYILKPVSFNNFNQLLKWEDKKSVCGCSGKRTESINILTTSTGPTDVKA